MSSVTLNDIETVANMLGLSLVSDKYINNRTNLIFKDKEDYYYVATYNNIKKGGMPKKFHISNPYTIQNIKLWLSQNNLNYNLVSDVYLGYKETIVLNDDEGYYYETTLDRLKRYKKADKFHISNSYTINNIDLWMKNNNKPFCLISNKYIGCDKKLKFLCLKNDCGETFESNWEDILQNRGCSFCAGKKVGLSNCLATKRPDIAKEWHFEKNGNLTPYEVAFKSHKEVWWQCSENPKHEWQARISVRHENGCPYCAGQLPSEEYNLAIINPELCLEWNYDKNKNQPKDYTPGSGKKVWWKCKECNCKWDAPIVNRNNNASNCPECGESKGEKRIGNWLRQRDITYVFQKTFDGLLGLGNGLLSYDFYLPEYGVLVEYQGQQHEKFVRSVHKTKKGFEKQKEHDKRKKEYALNNAYNFLEIWYWDYDNIESILEKTLKELKG